MNCVIQEKILNNNFMKNSNIKELSKLHLNLNLRINGKEK